MTQFKGGGKTWITNVPARKTTTYMKHKGNFILSPGNLQSSLIKENGERKFCLLARTKNKTPDGDTHLDSATCCSTN